MKYIKAVGAAAITYVVVEFIVALFGGGFLPLLIAGPIAIMVGVSMVVDGKSITNNTVNSTVVNATAASLDPSLAAAKELVGLLEVSIKSSTDINNYFGDVCYTNFYRDKKDKCEKGIELKNRNFDKEYALISKLVSLDTKKN